MDAVDTIVNICLEYTDDIYAGPDIINVEDILNEADGMVFNSVSLKRSQHKSASVFLYRSIIAVKMNVTYLSDLGRKLAKFRLGVKQCIANREGECVVKFVRLKDEDDDLIYKKP